MARRKKILGRREMENRVEKAGKEMEEKEDILEKDVSDIETIRKTLDGLKAERLKGLSKSKAPLETQKM